MHHPGESAGLRDGRRTMPAEGISESLYYRCSKEFLEAGEQRRVGNTKRQATSVDVSEGNRASQPVNGQGYEEMTGYASSMQD